MRRHPGHLRADIAHADDAQRLAAYVAAVDLAHIGHLAAFQPVVVGDRLLGQHKDQADGVLGHRTLVGLGGVAHLNPPGRSRLHINPVHADPMHGNHLQVGTGVKNPGRKLAVPRQCAITVHTFPQKRLLLRPGAHNKLVALFPQKLQPLFVHSFGD